MDVIAHARAVHRIVVVPEYVQLLQAPDRNLGDIREQVVWNPAGIFADAARGVRSDRIEIAQCRMAETRRTAANVRENRFDELLGPAVRVHCAQRVSFLERQALRVAIYGCR